MAEATEMEINQHAERLLEMRAFALRQISSNGIGLDHAEQSLLTANAYDAKYYRKEIDRCAKRIATFQKDVAALNYVIGLVNAQTPLSITAIQRELGR